MSFISDLLSQNQNSLSNQFLPIKKKQPTLDMAINKSLLVGQKAKKKGSDPGQTDEPTDKVT